MAEGKESKLSPLSSRLNEMIGGEDILIEVARELIKDEIKKRVREVLKENPELEKELKDAVGMYFEAKVKENYAGLKMAKSGAKLTLEMLPDHMKKDLSKDIEKEVLSLLERSIR